MGVEGELNSSSQKLFSKMAFKKGRAARIKPQSTPKTDN